jgi:flagellar motor component MotA
MYGGIIMARKIVAPMIVLILGCIGMFAVGGGGGADLFLFWDFPTFLIVPVLAFLYVAGGHGFHAISEAYKAALSPEVSQKELAQGIAVFEALKAAIWHFALLVLALSIILILRYLADPALLGPNLAVAILVILYAPFFNMLLVLPFLNRLKQRLAEQAG